MKRATRKWLVDLSYLEPAHDALDSDARQRAEIRDLKARLSVVAASVNWWRAGRDGPVTGEISELDGDGVLAALDLKNKDWNR